MICGVGDGEGVVFVGGVEAMDSGSDTMKESKLEGFNNGRLWKQRERKTKRSKSRILLSLHKMNTSPTLSIYTLQDW